MREEREREERVRERQRQTETERGRDRERETDRQTDRQRDRQRERQTDRERNRQTDRQTDRQTEDLVRVSGQLVNRVFCSVDNPVQCRSVSTLLLRGQGHAGQSHRSQVYPAGSLQTGCLPKVETEIT